MISITQSELKELLDYNKDTGLFTRKIRTANAIHIGDVAGSLHSTGRVYISLFNKSYMAHRLVWLYEYGIYPKSIDHINGINSDNRLSNLRLCTQSQNMENQRKARSNSKTKILGVSYNEKLNKFYARITVNGVKKYLGLFTSLEEAHQVYLTNKRRLHGFCTI